MIECETSPGSASLENLHLHEVPSCRACSRGRDSRRFWAIPFEAWNDSRYRKRAFSNLCGTWHVPFGDLPFPFR
jgi:hypothetical protein